MTTPPAPCTTDPDLFWSTLNADEQKAVAICDSCPLRPGCAQYALDNDERWGTWGGMTASDRIALRRGRGWWMDTEGRVRPPCGSEEAFALHHRYEETPCLTCQSEHDTRIGAGRRERLAVQHALPAGGSVRGYELHRMLGEPTCEACRVAVAAASATARAVRAAKRLGSASGSVRAGSAAA